MKRQDLFTALARCATARAHLAAAEAPAFAVRISPVGSDEASERAHLDRRFQAWRAARARYWRELSTAAILAGAPSWPAAEQLGGRA